MRRGPEVTVRASVRIAAKLGLHARPCTAIARLVGKHASAVRLTWESSSADARSIIELMTLNVPGGVEIGLEATGTDAQELVEALRDLLEGASPFD